MVWGARNQPEKVRTEDMTIAAAGASRAAVAQIMLEATILVSLVLALTTWFAGWPRGLAPALPAGLAIASFVARWLVSRRALPRPAPETLVCLTLATVYRLPVLLYPWGWVNRDGFYSAMVTLHVLQGTRPAPPFLEGVNYQGTIKAHLAALLSVTSGITDLSFLSAVASGIFFLLFIAASMALARRVGGRGAALVTGLYLALAPKFLTTITMNGQGHYVEILALGGLALALLARMLEESAIGARARLCYFGVGLLVGAAFWQQPVALCYIAVVLAVLALRRATWTDPWALLVPIGLLVGVLPALLWNVQNDWGTADIMRQNTAPLSDTLRGMPRHISRTFGVSFPVLAGLNVGHPWTDVPGLRYAVASVPIVLLLAYLALRREGVLAALRRWRPSAVLLAPLLMVASLAAFWLVPAELAHIRPRYLLPVMAATAIHLGVVAAWAWRRSRALSVLGMGLLLALNVFGTVPRLVAGKGLSEYYHRLVRSLEQKGIRTGYADFPMAAAITMFTAERIVISSRLGPTPNYESTIHARMVDQEGPNAFILHPRDDVEGLAARLTEIGVSYRLEREPVPVFYALSRRVRFSEVAGFRR